MSSRAVWLAWVLTRSVCVLLILASAAPNSWLGIEPLASDVHFVYWGAHQSLWSGRMPYRGFAYEYPPATVVFLLLPFGRVGPQSFLVAYTLQMLVLDAAVQGTLLRRPRSGARAAARLWTAGGAATLGLMLCRNDLPAALVSVVALFALADGRRGRAVVLLSVGAWLKVWPIGLAAVVVAGTRRLVGRAAATLACVSALALAPFAATGALGDLWQDLVGYHGGRGVEIESVAALPALLWDAAVGRNTALDNDHSSTNLVHSQRLGELCSLACVLVVATLVWWLVTARRRRGDLPAGTLLISSCLVVDAALMTSKVLSPQYLLWLLAVVCVARCEDAVDVTTARLTLAVMVLTALVFPLDFSTLGTPGIAGSVPALLLAVRAGIMATLGYRWWRQLRIGLA